MQILDDDEAVRRQLGHADLYFTILLISVLAFGFALYGCLFLVMGG